VAVELLKHQIEAIEYRHRNQELYPNFLVGDSMGVGKTYTGIGIDFELRAQHPGPFHTLIVCQKNGIDVWKKHLEAYGVPADRILTIDPSDRSAFDSALAELAGGVRSNFLYYIVHWNALILLKNLLPPKVGRKWIVWDHVIGDEIHLAKNPKAKRTIKFKKIKTRYKTGASGTPADDKPQDFWSVLNWLYPREFGSYWRFYNQYLDWETHPYNGYRVIKGTKNIPELHRRIRPFYIRRRLTEVVENMPEKTHDQIMVEMTPRQLRDYRSMEKFQTARLGELDEQYVATAAIEMHIRLLQMTLGTCELDWTYYEKFWDKWGNTPPELLPKSVPYGPRVKINEPSPKLDALMEDFENHEEEQFVVFTNFRDFVRMVEARCEKSGIPISTYTGAQPNQKIRDAAVVDFQSGKNRVFVGTVGAAGTSITLTAAHTLTFADRHWNPSKNEQAEDRIWRIGQKNACQIWDIIARGTVDEPRTDRIWQKALNVREIVDIDA
jgi:SNF2 family DNA or RNA helicase